MSQFHPNSEGMDFLLVRGRERQERPCWQTGSEQPPFRRQGLCGRVLPQDRNLWESSSSPAAAMISTFMTAPHKTICVSCPASPFARLSQNVTALIARSLEIRRNFSIKLQEKLSALNPALPFSWKGSSRMLAFPRLLGVSGSSPLSPSVSQPDKLR